MKKTKKLKKIALLDVHAIIHRSYHALPDFISSQGEPTGALYGLVAGILKIVEDWQPEAIIACYDLPGPTFRRQIYDDYKAGRKKTDDSLIEQIKRSRDIFASFNIPSYDYPGFEADDIIGTISKQLVDNPDWQVIIFSGDLDTLQLVKDDKVVVQTFKKGIKEMMVYNEKAVIKRYGFSPTLIPDFKGLAGDQSDNIIGVSGIGERTASLLIARFGNLEKIFSLLDKGKEEIFLKAGIKERFINLLKTNREEALFSKALATIRKDAPIEFKIPKGNWQENLDQEKVLNILSELEFRQLINRFKNIFSNGQELSSEKKFSSEEELLLKKAQLGLWLINSDIINPTIDDLTRSTNQKELPAILEKIEEKIKKNNLEKVYYEIELPLIAIMEKIEERGILIDKQQFVLLNKKYKKYLQEISAKIYKIAGQEFNLNSPKQMAEILFDILKISTKGLRKTTGGARSTRESELSKLKDSHPIIPEILKYREVQKINSSYVENIPKLIDSDGRLRTNLNQAGTTTGRMSSSRPNLQNIPANEEFGREIKKAFIATPKHLFLSADYSQIEMRVLAVLSGDKSLIKFFKEGKDIHSAVASLVFKKTEEKITREERRRAKVINFGIIYGMGINALKENLNVSRQEAQKFYDDYFNAFPSVKNYFEKVVKKAEDDGYTETLFGRRRYFPSLKSPLPFIKASGRRMAMNAPLQGTAADLLKLAIIAINQELEGKSLIDKIHLILQIHDELIYEVEEKHISQAEKIIKDKMENVWSADVPLKVDIKTGKNWGEID
ncbi:MAG TPA: hypothetical protein ENN31_00240 [Candidatus Vogelbacteria bacterium]|nr:hypothetical protein [Candidatus Vogelbacteria bacterium]